MEIRRDDLLISTDSARLDRDLVFSFLSERAYWAMGRPRAVVDKSIANSLCFGVFEREQQVGFARVVTDYATFAWVCDVFILESHRGRGLSKWLIETIVAHPDLRGLRRMLLATRDAHGLYQRYGGFTPLRAPERWLERFDPAQNA